MSQQYKGLAQIRKEHKEQFVEFTTSLRQYGALIPSSTEVGNSVITTLSRFGDENSSKKITVSLDTESGIVTASFAMGRVLGAKRTFANTDWLITYDDFAQECEEHLKGSVGRYMDDKFNNNVLF